MSNLVGEVGSRAVIEIVAMSRFGHLEFNAGQSPESQLGAGAGAGSGSGSRARTEADYAAAAAAAFESGRFELALRHYAKVLEFSPGNVAAWVGQVRMLVELGEYEEARQWGDRGLERFPDEPELLAAMGVALARLGDLKGGMAYSDASIGCGRETSYLWLARGDVQLAGDDRRASYCFEKAFSLEPGGWVVRWLAARILYYYKKFAQAMVWVRGAMELTAAPGVLWMLQGQCQLALGFAGPARESLVQARELCPDTAQVDSVLREIYRAGFSHRLRWMWRRWCSG